MNLMTDDNGLITIIVITMLILLMCYAVWNFRSCVFMSNLFLMFPRMFRFIHELFCQIVFFGCQHISTSKCITQCYKHHKRFDWYTPTKLTRVTFTLTLTLTHHNYKNWNLTVVFKHDVIWFYFWGIRIINKQTNLNKSQHENVILKNIK